MSLIKQNDNNNVIEFWQKPIPFEQSIAEQPYPIKALPQVMQQAVLNYQSYGQQPISMVACSAIANLSLACQSLANVARDRLLVSPVSLYFITSSLSGERKTACDNAFGTAIRAWEKDTREKLTPIVKTAKSQHQAWKVEREGILSRIKRSITSEEELFALQERLTELAFSEPEVPLAPMLFFEDATPEALAKHLATGWPSASLWSDEAGTVIGSQAMNASTTKFVALLNRLWDNKEFATQRKTSNNFILSNRRLTISLMMQPLILENMLKKNNGIIRQSGFLPRCLIASPKSTMGERYYKEPPESMPDLHLFHEKLIDCLSGSLDLSSAGCHNLPVLKFSNKAKSRWIEFFNIIEKNLSNDGKWISIADFASKAAENVARLAALFHLFEGKTGYVNVENTERATEVISWHLGQARNIVGYSPVLEETLDAKKILKWLAKKSLSEITPRQLLQSGPIRDKKQRDNAISELIPRNYIKLTKKDNLSVIMLNPYTI